MAGLRDRMTMETQVQVANYQRTIAETMHRKVSSMIDEATQILEREIREELGLHHGTLAKDSPLRAGIAPLMATLRDKFATAVLLDENLQALQERLVQHIPHMMESALRNEAEKLAVEVAREAIRGPAAATPKP